MPLASASAPPALPRRSATKVATEGAATEGKAAMPSALEPDRKKDVSVGAVAGAQPSEDERKAAPEGQAAQAPLP